MELILGFIGAVLALLVGRSLLGRGRPAGAGRDDQGVAREAEGLAGAARTEAARASEQRAEADHAAANEILNRPHTDDPVADLEARLGRGTAARRDAFFHRADHQNGDGPRKPAPPSDS